MKNKKFLGVVAIIIFVLLILVIRISFVSKPMFKPYDKYELSIIVNAISNDTTDRITVTFKYDGENGRITSNFGEKEAYLIGEKLQYLKEETVYTFVPKTFYDDLNLLLANTSKADKVDEVGQYVNYSSVLSFRQLNKILSALCIEKKTSSDSIVRFSVKGEHISSVNISIGDLEGYKKVDIMLNFDEVSDNYKVSTTKILGNEIRPYKYENVRENVFSIVG